MKKIPIIFILLLLPLLASCVEQQVDPTANNINYPPLTIRNFNGTAKVTRTLTNVGPSKNVYVCKSVRFNGLYVAASPSQLPFNQVGEKKSFTITVQTDALGPPPKGKSAFGEYTWTDGVRNVRTRVSVYFA